MRAHVVAIGGRLMWVGWSRGGGRRAGVGCQKFAENSSNRRRESLKKETIIIFPTFCNSKVE